MDNNRKKQSKEDKESRSCASSGTANSEDLIPGLVNEITVAHIISRLPWYEIPFLRTLNSTWYENSNYANYWKHYQSGVLANSFIFYTKNASNQSRNLQIYQDGVVRRLPFPHSIPSQSRPKILVTDHCIYCLTFRDNSQNVYNVYTLDLAGGIIEWQSLSPLPNRGNYIYADNNTNSIWMRKYSPTEADKWSWSAWMPTIAGNPFRDNKRFSEWQTIPADLSLHVQTNFINIQVGDDQRHIYGRLFPFMSLSDWSILQFCEPEHNYQPEVLLVFQEDYDGIKGVVSKVGRICWWGDRGHGNGNFTVMLNKIKLQHVEEEAAIEGQDDLNAFQHWWRRLSNHKMKTYKLDKQWVGRETWFSCEGNDSVFNKFFRLAGHDTVCPYFRMVSGYSPARRFQNTNGEFMMKFRNRYREYMRGERGNEVSVDHILNSLRHKFLLGGRGDF